MGQEFVIKSTTLEDKINQLLPSQGGFEAGVDLSASTTIIPIVDLTESAEGSNFREDLQTALSLNSIQTFAITNTTTTMINTTGYYRVFGNASLTTGGFIIFSLTDGTTTKNLNVYIGVTNGDSNNAFDFIVFLKAGESLTGQSSASGINLYASTRQIADLSGNLINPT
jgi:hypothetical protein